MGMGLKDLINPNDSLRYSLVPLVIVTELGKQDITPLFKSVSCLTTFSL